MQLKILSKKEIKSIKAKIEEQFGCEPELDYVFLKNSKDKLYMVNKQVFDFDETKLRIDTIGIYFGKLEKIGLRLSIEGSQMIGPSATRNVMDTDIEWIKGKDQRTDQPDSGYVIMRCNNDYLGCGRVIKGELVNFFPKNRRVDTISGCCQ